MTHHLSIANTDGVSRTIDDWADTETALEIGRTLDLMKAEQGAAITMIAGAPGTGKTTAVKRFYDQTEFGVLYVQAARGEGSAWNFAQTLANIWGYSAPKFRSLSEARLEIGSYINSGTVLIVDEAQYLNQKNNKTGQVGEAYEWLRAMSDGRGISIVFCGDLNLPNAIYSTPQLKSRLLRPLVINKTSRVDVAAIVDNTPFANPVAIDVLHAVAGHVGGLRNVKNVTRIAQLFAGDGTPTAEHLKAAIVDMKLPLRGGR